MQRFSPKNEGSEPQIWTPQPGVLYHDNERQEHLVLKARRTYSQGFPSGLVVNESTCQCGRPWVRKDPLGEEMVTHASILDWEIPRTKEPGRLLDYGGHKSQM